MNDYDLENQSRDRRWLIRRRSATVLTGIGVSETSPLKTRCNFRSTATILAVNLFKGLNSFSPLTFNAAKEAQRILPLM